MNIRRLGIGVITTAMVMLMGAASAFAAPAQITYDTTLMSGPDKSAAAVGRLGAGARVDLGACSGYWCQVTVGGTSGWVPSDAVSQIDVSPQPQPLPQPQPQPQPQPWPLPHPQPWPQPHPQPWPQPQPPVYEDAGACFYSERNFGGSSFCLEEGDSYNRLQNWNDRIRSVEVFGGAHVDLCTDRNLYGSCLTLTSDARRLPSQLDRKASSLEVY